MPYEARWNATILPINLTWVPRHMTYQGRCMPIPRPSLLTDILVPQIKAWLAVILPMVGAFCCLIATAGLVLGLFWRLMRMLQQYRMQQATQSSPKRPASSTRAASQSRKPAKKRVDDQEDDKEIQPLLAHEMEKALNSDSDGEVNDDVAPVITGVMSRSHDSTLTSHRSAISSHRSEASSEHTLSSRQSVRSSDSGRKSHLSSAAVSSEIKQPPAVVGQGPGRTVAVRPVAESGVTGVPATVGQGPGRTVVVTRS